ncbi:MAG TPA: SDR family NAD(P)-dependent oxidoreductase [Acidimicrobiales bacterium]|nr:SDR family NAD(P)-dependent oxidoreductase [Acidimicrobiales bacterium]
MTTALITGASRGLGRALARDLAGAGWNLILDARGEADLAAVAAELGGWTTVRAIPGDIADEAHRQALAAAARDLDGLDALVHNASSLGPTPLPRLAEVAITDLAAVYEVNVLAPLRLTQVLLPVFRPGARVVAITSDAAVEAYEGWGAYGSSKAALEALFAVLAAEHPELRVHRVDPGDMNTRMQQDAFPGEDVSDRPPPEDSVPGLRLLLEGDRPSGRWQARALAPAVAR